MLCTIATSSTSKQEGVSWNEKRKIWQAVFYFNGQKRISYFQNKFDADNRIKKLCDKMKISSKPREVLNQQELLKNEKTSQYKGVYWNHQSGKWYAYLNLKGRKQKYGGTFKNELDAAKRVNQLCEEMKILPKNPEIEGMPNQPPQKKEKTSQYKGVHWHNKKWYVHFYFTGGKQKYGGTFKNELDAAKRVNQLCEEMEILPKNPGITGMPNQEFQKNEKTSQYKGVYWNHQSGKWIAYLSLKGEKLKYGGTFKNELDAAKRVNQLCEEMEILPKNPEIEGMPNEPPQTKEQASQYKGVSWNKKKNKWFAHLHLKGQRPKFGGTFQDELDAAKRVNQLCEEMEISPQFPGIPGMPNQPSPTKQQKASQYKGVTWNKKRDTWCAHLHLKGGKYKFGGSFKDELDAAKK